MFGPYVHQIDPILFDIAGVHLWWYGLGFALGFLEIHVFLRRRHNWQPHLSLREVWSLSLFMAIGVLVGGRAVEIAFDEWPFYREHLELIPAYWLGGMATHGLMLGGAVGAGLFARRYRKSFLHLADTLVIPAAFLMGIGRLGNFIDGQIVGAVTEVWWGVKFPDADGFRHPVVLYDGAKNLLLMAYLMRVRRVNPTPGAAGARFVFWYAFPRFFIDLFRDYPTHRLAFGTGQTLNIVMVLLGAALLYRSRLRRLGRLKNSSATTQSLGKSLDAAPLASQRIAFICLLAFCLTIPSNWTQDIPSRYGERHPGLEYSWLYPMIDTTPRPTEPLVRNQFPRRFEVDAIGVDPNEDPDQRPDWYNARQDQAFSNRSAAAWIPDLQWRCNRGPSETTRSILVLVFFSTVSTKAVARVLSARRIFLGSQTSYGKTGLSPDARRRLASSTVR